MTAVTALLPVCAAIVTWLCTRARWRGRVIGLQWEWARLREELLGEIGSLRDEVMRARARAAQLSRDTAAWADGYQHGRNDMIRAAAALHGKLLAAGDAGGQAPASS
jgi:hypothetical protein